MKNNLSLGSLIAAIVIVLVIFFGVLMLFSAFTIMALNVLFVQEIISLTWATVFALAWLKFWISLVFGGLSRVKNI